MEPNRHQSRVIGHHLALVEEIPTSGYWDMSLNGQKDWQTDWLETQDILILYGVIIVNQLYCGCCDMLSIFMDKKHHQLVTYPVCEMPKTDFLYDLPTIDQYWPVSLGYQLSGYWLAISCLSGYWLAISWLLASYQLCISYLWADYGLTMGWLSAHILLIQRQLYLIRIVCYQYH